MSGEEVPARRVEHAVGEDDPDDTRLFDVGHASSALYAREITAAEKKRWRREDEERDRRRIPPGFRP